MSSNTDLLSLWQHGHPGISARVGEHHPSELATTVITVQEQLDGWHGRLSRVKRRDRLALVYQSLADTVRFLSRLSILSFTEPAIVRYEHLRSLRLNISKMDLRIAAITLEQGGILVSRNLKDFRRVPELQLEDWTA